MTADTHWFDLYCNAAERLFGVVNGVLTNEQDDACIAAANDADLSEQESARRAIHPRSSRNRSL